MSKVIIRGAEPQDAERLLGIYSYYVKNTAVSFEYDVPTPEEFRRRIENTIIKYPYLVIEEDGIIQGYAYAGPFHTRAAYRYSCELAVYVVQSSHKRGLGRKLYEAMEQRLMSLGYLNMYACIAYPEVEDEYLSTNSADFHAHLGFTKVGELHKCGYKFGRWYNIIWMEKIIGAHYQITEPKA